MSDALRTFSSAYRSALGRFGLLGPQRRSRDDRQPAGGPRGRLFRKYVVLLVGLVSLVLLVNAGLHFWFSYNENKTAAFRIQQEKAVSAARQIEEFAEEIERQLGWTTAPQWAAGPIEQRRFDYFRLLRQVPAITELIQLDGSGQEQLKVSRIAMDVVGSGKDYSQDPGFIEARQHRVWFSPVYFHKESEPYMTLAMAQAGRNAGVTIAEVNLKLIWDVITGMRTGKGGYAYVVDRGGRLIAHPDISLVLRNTELATLRQVVAARAEASAAPAAGPTTMIATNIAGVSVLTAHAAIASLGWTVFVELPLSEALAPLYASLLQNTALLAVAIGLATLAALFLARRMVGPIRLLQAGAARIGAGELDRRIDIHTGDELEELAGGFNRMAGELQKSYAELEQKVEKRTAELKEALDQQTATAEVLQVINSSPGDLAPVFDAMLEKALRLCDAAFGVLWTLRGDRFRPTAHRGVPTPYAEYLAREVPAAGPGTGRARLLAGERFVHTVDLADEEPYRAGESHRRAVVDLGGARTALLMPLRNDGAVTGFILIYRQEVRPFTDKQIALLQNFAAQAVIAMENARLLTETREALEQQTATAEVLQVINSSPGDLAPVFDAMLEKAMRLCGAAFGVFAIYDEEHYRVVANHGVPLELAEFVKEAVRIHPGSMPDRLRRGEDIVQVPDITALGTELRTPGLVAMIELGNARTAVWVALRKDGVAQGFFGVYRQEVRPFSDKQITLLQNFAAQAVIAIENARLISETREALEQQTATAEVLQVINSSPGDLAPVFDAMLDKAMHLCEAAFGILWTYDGEWIQAAALRGATAAYAQFLTSTPHRPGLDNAHGRLLRGERFVHLADAEADAAYQSDDPIRRATVELGGARTLLAVPLRKDEVFLGDIVIYRRDVQPFSEKQIALLENFAAQAVIAMENARLITELRQRTHDLQESLEYQTASGDVLKVISQSGGELEPVLDTLVKTAARLCDADMAFIHRREGEVYRPAAVLGFPPEFTDYLDTHPLVPGRGSITGRVALEGRAIHIADVAADREYQLSQSILMAKQRTTLGVPLLREDVPIGVIVLARQRVEPFTEKQIGLVTTFADQAVIAIENARLFNELRARTAELGRSVDELKMLSEVGQAVSSTLDLRAVLSTILTRSVALTGADAGAIFRYNRAGREFRLVEEVGWDEALARAVGDLRIAEAETAMGEAAARRAPMQIADLAERPSAPLRDASLAVGFRSVLIVPLVGPQRILGALVLQRRATGEFPAETVRLTQTLASQSVLAIQNARLFREIADKSEQLALASQHKSQFLANMSHELRTPLNAILGYAELLVDGIYGVLPEKAQGVLERVQDNGKHLLALINDVLDLAKIEAGQLTLTLEDYNLPEVVKSVVTATEPLATAKGLKFAAIVQADLPTAHGDARRVSQVLLNLVGNAIKFTDEGEVEIRALAANGQFVLTVRDTGPGIVDADQERIFGEFQQIDNTSTRKQGGTGLGLAIAKRMVELQGGTISVESALGQGSTFRVVLPIHVDEMMEAAE
jgi:signal transduction histidine kinase